MLARTESIGRAPFRVGCPSPNAGEPFWCIRVPDCVPPYASASMRSNTGTVRTFSARYGSRRLTLPDPLAAIGLQNKKVVYGLLFRATAETLRTIAAPPREAGPLPTTPRRPGDRSHPPRLPPPTRR